MTSDMVQWAQVSPIGVGEDSGGELVRLSQPPPEFPDPRTKKVRHRPNNGRQRRFIGPFLADPPWDMLRETGYPIPTDVKCLSRVPPRWRRGLIYRKWRLDTFARWGTVCHLCNHEGANTADHLIPLAEWGNQPYDARLSRPAHGIDGCPTCHVKCNSSRGNRAHARFIRDYKPPVAL